MHEGFEEEIIDNDKELSISKKKLDLTRERSKVFEKEFEIEYDETITIRDMAQIYKAETFKYKRKLAETTSVVEKIEKEMEIADKIIQSLKTENNELKRAIENNNIEKIQ